MRHINWKIILIISLCGLSFAESEEEGKCESPQYLPFGKKATIHCDFGEGFYGVYWYNTPDYNTADPFLHFTQGHKSGIGYDTGEFDVYPNGSLIVANVSLTHEHIFTVVMFRGLSEPTIPTFVEVIVTVRPIHDYPVIDLCNGQRVCFRKAENSKSLNCYIKSYRPVTNLTLSVLTAVGNVKLPGMLSSVLEDDLYTTTGTLSLPVTNTSVYTAISCEASEPPYLLDSRNSVILLQNVDVNMHSSTQEEIFVEQHGKTKLECAGQSLVYIVWMKNAVNGVRENLAEVITENPYYQNVVSQKYNIDKTEMSLELGDVDIHDEGHYICVSGDGIKEYVTTFDLNVYIRPDPPALTVEGCRENRYCEIETTGRGVLICKLEGVRPKLNLTWNSVRESSTEISFQYANPLINRDGDTYDITLVAEYVVNDLTRTRIPVSCRVDLPTDHRLPFHMSHSVDLIVVKDIEETTQPLEVTISGSSPLIKIVLPIVFVLVIACLILLVTIYIARRCHVTTMRGSRKNRRHIESEQGLTMHLTHSESMSGKTNILKQQLTSKYKELCEAVRRLPQRGKTAIADIFVEEGMESLITDSSNNKIWSKLDSYHDILRNTLQDARIILEGGAGYGKSILCLQMAYDWYTKEESSPLKDVDVFILLYLRYSGNDVPLHQAIKQHLLPSDTQLTSEDINDILSTTSSAVIVLDGFNRYPLLTKYEETEIKKVMLKNKLQNCKVMVTTRTAVLPAALARLTERIRLSGFDDEAQEKYIHKVLAANDEDEVERIISVFDNVPGIFAFCQVPMFFTLLADLTHDQKISNITDTTVTKFFQSIMNGLQQVSQENFDHQQNDELRPLKKKLNEQSFHKEALTGLFNKEKGLLWDQGKLRFSIGKEVYAKYFQIGILVEEEVYESRNFAKFQATSSRDMEYHKKVKFYHNIFCEWFAAHELSRMLSSKSYKASVKILQQVNPVDHQYVFRFACGMNEKAAKHIIQYLESIKDGEKFATLCIMETGGIENVTEVVKHMCSLPVHISKEHSHLQQRSTAQVLVLAAENEIPIEIVWLADMGAYFNPAKESLTFNSGVSLPVLETMNQLSITETEKELTVDRLRGILEYAELCEDFGGIRFRGCLLPFQVPTESLREIQKNKISVDWMPPVGKRTFYHLNLKEGLWEIDGDKMTFEEYKNFRDKIKKIETDPMSTP